ncbi:hypothetical protein BDZ90DRAFT_262959 [Jaminaea rosea]|uniref:Uncharacterized protein n=1 Tax=Jaminaea rosea TaxID=1569628 RepID=A0A316UK47_9BASI|nr:hypothetical protein BDZ90DRAFT_262959 [Jaminaea rosea]PWN24741.1 hypothetical protein BDZ90DRAFT_262959 [Jaminaea rosea]
MAAPDSASGSPKPSLQSETAHSQLQVTIKSPSSLPTTSQLRITAIEGQELLDDPNWTDFTRASSDRRLMKPLTMRFVSQSPTAFDRLFEQHNDVRRCIWEKLSQQMGDCGLKDRRSTILIDRDPLVKAQEGGYVDITFSSETAFARLLGRLSSIRLVLPCGAVIVLTRTDMSNSLRGDIMPFDVLRLPVTVHNAKDILRSLDDMASGVGSVIGIAKHEIIESSFNPPQVISDKIRGWIKLWPASMTLPFAALVERLPTACKWRGVPFTLWYPGRALHKTASPSIDYPIEVIVDEDDSRASSSTSRSRSSTVLQGSHPPNKRKKS